MELQEVAFALRNTHCDGSQRELVSNLNWMAGILRNSMIMNHSLGAGGLLYAIPDTVQGVLAPPKKPVIEEKAKTVYTDPEESYSMYLEHAHSHSKDLLRQLMAATDDSKCVHDLHSAGMVSSIADIAVNLGQMSLFVPGPNGLAAGLGTLGFAATLKVLSALLKSPYDWNLEKDRLHFLDLNCNFFDLRKELEEADFFDTHGVDKAEKARKGKRLIEVFDQKIMEISKAQERFENDVIATQDEFYGSRIGKNKIAFYRLLLKAETALSLPVDEGNAEMRYKITKDIASIAAKMIPLVSSEINEAYAEYLLEMLKSFAIKKLPELDKLKMNKLKSRYLSPLTLYTRTAKESIESEIKVHIYAYEKQRVNENESNAETIQRGLQLFKSLLKEVNDKQGQLVRRISLYEAKSRKTLFGSYEGGAHMNFDVLKEYKENQNLIFGEIGWSFLRYLIKTTDRDIADFLQNQKTWVKKYKDGRHLSEDLRAWACRDANQLRVKWNMAFSTVGLANDFYETNKGIFQTEFEKKKLTLRLFPVARSETLKIYGNIRALEMAKSIIEGKEDYSKYDVRSAYRGHRSNLGELALKVKESEFLREKIDSFFKDMECILHL